jgi:hypothetical protein
MKHTLFIISLLCLSTFIKAQNGTITCDGTPKHYSFGYINYNADTLGTIVKVEYSQFLFWYSFKDISVVGVVRIPPTNSTNSNSGTNTVAVDEQMAVNISGEISAEEKAAVSAAANSSLRIVDYNGNVLHIMNPSLCNESIRALNLPPLTGRDFYAIVNQITVADSVRVGFSNGTQISASITIPEGTGNVSVSLGCGTFLSMNSAAKSSKICSFFDITPINPDLTVATDVSVKNFIIAKENQNLTQTQKDSHTVKIETAVEKFNLQSQKRNPAVLIQ